MIKTPSVMMLSDRRSCAAVRPAVEARQFAHEIVEAPRRGAEFAQRNPQRKARRRRPQKQRQMREITALDEGADQVGHLTVVPQIHTVILRSRALARRLEGSATSTALVAILRGSP